MKRSVRMRPICAGEVGERRGASVGIEAVDFLER